MDRLGYWCCLHSQAVRWLRETMKQKYYGVKIGRNPGIYTNWNEVERNVKGFPKAKYKKFSTFYEAQLFVNDNKPLINPSYSTSSSIANPEPIMMGVPTVANLPVFNNSSVIRPFNLLTSSLKTNFTQMYAVTTAAAPKHCTCVCTCGALPQVPLSCISVSQTVIQDVTDNALKRSAEFTNEFEPPLKLQSFINPSSHCGAEFDIPIHVYTDGACAANGRVNSHGGIGVYWGPNHPMNISEPLLGRQSSNRAEIIAAVRALRQAKSAGLKNIVLHTDSKFLINGITTWIYRWKKNGWKLLNGGDVINRPDFEALDEAQKGLIVTYKYVKGHSADPGNDAADRLAIQARDRNFYII